MKAEPWPRCPWRDGNLAGADLRQVEDAEEVSTRAGDGPFGASLAAETLGLEVGRLQIGLQDGILPHKQLRISGLSRGFWRVSTLHAESVRHGRLMALFL